MADDRPPDNDTSLESREPTVEDLRDLCRALNERGARYIVIGGFAIRAAGYNRRLLWRMKAVTGREKDAGDLVFLRYWFAERGEVPE